MSEPVVTCPECDYDLSGQPLRAKAHCPECGKEWVVVLVKEGVFEPEVGFTRPPVTEAWKLLLPPALLAVFATASLAIDAFMISLAALPGGVLFSIVLLCSRIPDRRRIGDAKVRRRVLYVELASHVVMLMVCAVVSVYSAERIAAC